MVLATVQVDAIIKALGDNCQSQLLFTDSIDDATGWAVVNGLGVQIRVDGVNFPNEIEYDRLGNFFPGHLNKLLNVSNPTISSFSNIKLEFKYNHTFTELGGTQGGMLMGLTDSTGKIINAKRLGARHTRSGGQFKLQAQMSDLSTTITSAQVDIPTGVDTYITVEKIGTNIKLTAFSDQARTISIGASPLVSVAGLNQITFDQVGGSGNNVVAGLFIETGRLDDIQIFKGCSGNFTVDSFVLAEGTIAGFQINAILVGRRNNFSVDTILKAFDQQKTFEISGILIISPSALTEINGLLSTVNTETFQVDVLLKQLGVNGCGTSFFTTDVSSAVGWVPVANDVGGVSVTGGQLQGWGSDGGITREIFYDLVTNNGVTISNTNWTAEFDFQYNVPPTSTNPGHTPFTLSDSIATTDSFQTAGPATPSVPHPRSISMQVGNHNAFNIDRGVQILVKDTTTTTASSVAGLSGIIDLDAFPNITVYPRLERTSATTYKLSVFTDASRTIHVTGTASGADSPITLTALQVVTSTNFIHSSNSSAGGAGRVLGGFIDNLSIFSASSGGNTLLSDDFAVDNWADQGTKIQVNTGTQVIDVDGSMDGLIHSTAFDLGSPVSDTGFNLRFKLDVTSTAFTTGNISVRFGLYDSDETVADGIGDGITIEYNVQNTTGIRRYVSRGIEGVTTFGNAAFFSGFGLTTHFIEVIRNSATSVTLNVYSDSLFTTLIGTTTFAIPATIGGLRYIKVKNNDTNSLGGTLIGTVDDVLLTGVIVGAGCPTLNIDAILKVLPKVFTTDAILVSSVVTVNKNFLVDARIKLIQTKVFTADGLLAIMPSRMYCIDSFLKATQTEPFTIDSRLIVRKTTTYTVDAFLQESPQIPVDFDVDAILRATFDEIFTIDARLRGREDFEVDAKLNRQVQFIVDASITPDTTSPPPIGRDIGDLIIRVLFEDQDLGGNGLTGSEIVDDIIVITTVELQWGFRGKVSRIKNWIGFLENTNTIQEDDSSPDWYKTVWTLVNPSNP